MLTDLQMQSLAEKIKKYLKEDFELIHLSKNLMNTITINKSANGFEVEIPAEMYNIQKFLKEKVIVPTGKGSYAQEVNIDGGWSGRHIAYVEFAIQKAINEWLIEQQLDGKVVSVE